MLILSNINKNDEGILEKYLKFILICCSFIFISIGDSYACLTKEQAFGASAFLFVLNMVESAKVCDALEEGTRTTTINRHRNSVSGVLGIHRDKIRNLIFPFENAAKKADLNWVEYVARARLETFEEVSGTTTLTDCRRFLLAHEAMKSDWRELENFISAGNSASKYDVCN